MNFKEMNEKICGLSDEVCLFLENKIDSSMESYDGNEKFNIFLNVFCWSIVKFCLLTIPENKYDGFVDRFTNHIKEGLDVNRVKKRNP